MGMTASRSTGSGSLRLAMGDLLLASTLAGLVAAAWLLSRRNLFKAGDDVGYWLGVAGGLMMLLLFSYPLRKHVRRLHGWGKVKWWFRVHMALGIAGPLLILLHSRFQFGSINAAVALYSMLVVVGSGVVGRFLYVRVNRGLHGEKAGLQQLQARAGLAQGESRSLLHFAPGVEARLAAFERGQLARPGSPAGFGLHLLVLPVKQRLLERACAADLKACLGRLAPQRGWTAVEQARREHQARQLVHRYLAAVARVARSQAYARLFALWHVAHVPFVCLMVISTAVHVVAVHSY
jgi:hypothetical protein